MPVGVKLISMPFGDIHRPSLGLAQLKSVTESSLDKDVSVHVHNLDLEMAHRIGPGLYFLVAADMSVYVSGFGDWLFRQVAFPDEPDNSEEYFTRYAGQLGKDRTALINEKLLPVREGLTNYFDDMIDKYALDRADIVGMTSMFSQNMASIAMARRIKERNPAVITVMGGANCEGEMGVELVSNAGCLDFVFSGHSLVSFPTFVGLVAAGDINACHRMDGVFSRLNTVSAAALPLSAGKNARPKLKDQLIGISQYAPELDINTVIPLEYDEFIEKYDELLPDVQERPGIPFETSRGCWWGERAHCTFCGLNGGTMVYRAMSPELALPFIENLVERYADRTGQFECADNIMPKEFIDGVFGKLSVPPHVSMFYEVKADLSDEAVKTLSKAGVRSVQPGIESLSTSTLKLMRKGTNAFNNIRFLMSCLAYGVEPHWNLLVGFPGEGLEIYEGYMKVLPRLFHLPPPAGVYPVRFDRFSPYFVNADEYGLDLKAYDHYSLCFPFPDAAIQNMAYFFEDLNYEAAYARDVATALSDLKELVARWQRRWRRGAARPTLSLKAGPGEKYWIEDTRAGVIQRIPLSTSAVQLLSEVTSPLEESRARQAARDFAELDRRGFVFAERGRVMSVVMGVAETLAASAGRDAVPA